jgi:hypothetical protein
MRIVSVTLYGRASRLGDLRNVTSWKVQVASQRCDGERSARAGNSIEVRKPTQVVAAHKSSGIAWCIESECVRRNRTTANLLRALC